MSTTVSVIVPVYNERYAIAACLDRVLAAPLPDGVKLEVVVVDDCSTDGTSEILAAFAKRHAGVKVVRHDVNRGKGAAIRSAVKLASGDICLIQDGDLEYDPADYPALLAPILDGSADAVYGSRFMSSSRRRALFFWHAVANSVLTTFCNVFTNLWLTDMETGYKAIRMSFLRHLPIRCDRFGIEPELTMKLAKQRCRVYEVPIRYNGRTYEEGKKVGAWDGVKALFVILWFWLIDDLYTEDVVGREILGQLNQTPSFNRWMTETLKPHVGRSALELGSGIGNMSALLCHRERYVASDVDDYYCDFLRRRFASRPNVTVEKVDLANEADFKRVAVELDTIICVNVLEHVDDDAAALGYMLRRLPEGGRLVLLVPHLQALYGTLDEAVGHRRRYSRAMLESLAKDAGFSVEKIFEFNRASAPGWLFNGRVLRKRHFDRYQLKLFDSMVWLFRLIDRWLPWPGQSIILIAAKPRAR